MLLSGLLVGNCGRLWTGFVLHTALAVELQVQVPYAPEIFVVDVIAAHRKYALGMATSSSPRSRLFPGVPVGALQYIKCCTQHLPLSLVLYCYSALTSLSADPLLVVFYRAIEVLHCAVVADP